MSFSPYTTEEIAERRGKVDGTNFDRKLVDVDGKKYEVKEKDVSEDANVPDTRPYKVYTCFLSHVFGDPTALVLENTLGATINWTEDSPGIYQGTVSSAVLTENKTFILYNAGLNDDTAFHVQRNNTTLIGVSHRQLGVGVGGFEANIEIRVYN